MSLSHRRHTQAKSGSGAGTVLHLRLSAVIWGITGWHLLRRRTDALLASLGCPGPSPHPLRLLWDGADAHNVRLFPNREECLEGPELPGSSFFVNLFSWFP